MVALAALVVAVVVGQTVAVSPYAAAPRKPALSEDSASHPAMLTFALVDLLLPAVVATSSPEETMVYLIFLESRPTAFATLLEH